MVLNTLFLKNIMIRKMFEDFALNNYNYIRDRIKAIGAVIQQEK